MRSEAVALETKLKNLSVPRLVAFMKKYPVTKLVDGVMITPIIVQS